MADLAYALLAEGPSDAALLPAIRWILERLVPTGVTLQDESLPARLVPPRKCGLARRVCASHTLVRVDLLFVHQDADRMDGPRRRQQVQEACAGANRVCVPVVPVRATEAWLLWCEPALRKAAGNPHGTRPLGLPNPREVEGVTRPKQRFERALQDASSRSERRGRAVRGQPRRVAELIGDYAPLLDAPAFQGLYNDTREALRQLGMLSTLPP